jgi:hypothetical protein
VLELDTRAPGRLGDESRLALARAGGIAFELPGREDKQRNDEESSHPPVIGDAAGFEGRRENPLQWPRGLTGFGGRHALLAQLVEHFHGKEGVNGSSPLEGFAFSAW